MEFRQFEREFLRLMFTTDADISAPALAFLIRIPIHEAEKHLGRLVDLGVLEIDSDDDGRLEYLMPSRPDARMKEDDPALFGHSDLVRRNSIGRGTLTTTDLALRPLAPAIWQRPRPSVGQAMAAMFLNALVCPGVGSMVGGKTAAGVAQLAMFALALPLVVFRVGIPVLIIAWVWSMVTGAQLLADAKE